MFNAAAYDHEPHRILAAVDSGELTGTDAEHANEYLEHVEGLLGFRISPCYRCGQLYHQRDLDICSVCGEGNCVDCANEWVCKCTVNETLDSLERS